MTAKHTDDYKKTLNLPATDFPMKANLSAREPEILKQWAQTKIYEAMNKANRHKPEFILHDGPIYANGAIHIGHALNRILKDIIIKSKTLAGFHAPFVPGWDCHGLPVELNIEKKYGKAGEKLNPRQFREKCRQYAGEQILLQREAFKRLGVFADWEKPYATMDFNFEADIVRALAKIIRNHHLQSGFKPVHWCIDCRSALAEAEVEYQTKNSSAIDVKFQVVNPEKFSGEGNLYLPVWTTTPWTLPANEAVALSPMHQYVLVQITQENIKSRLMIIKELLETCCLRYEILPADYQILGEFSEKSLKDLKLQHPLYPQKIVPVIFGAHVTVDTGTGAVHTAPAHGLEDYAAGCQYGLPVNNPVDEKGCFTPETEIFAGEFIFKANHAIIEILKNTQRLLAENKIQHSYPHCWRHKTPLIFRAAPQWFISMDKNHLRAQALKEIQKTQWLPDWGQSRISAMIEKRPDWCISRQRQWCMPMGLIIHKKTRILHPKMPDLLEKIAEKIQQAGSEAWHELDLKTFLNPDEYEHYEKSSDALDVWFDSGVTHFAVLNNKPADLYLEGSDQHRGWFNSSLLTSVAMTEKAPYKTVLTHGFVVDDKGRKMSKSLGNVIAPDKVVNSLGADVLRLWVSSTDYRAEISVSQEILTRTSDAYRRIRNTLRFLLANLHDFSPDENLISSENLLLLDQFILQQAQSLQQEIRQAYEKYEFHLIYQKLQHFCIVELGGFYLDIIKDRQYTLQKNSLARRSAQTAIYHLLQAMTRWIAPILSFTAEEVWQHLPPAKNNCSHSGSVFLTEFYIFPDLKINMDKIKIDWQEILKLREEVNKSIELKRARGEIGSALEAAVIVTAPEKMYDNLQRLAAENELRFVWISSIAEIRLGKQCEIEIIPLDKTYKKCLRCWHRCQETGKNITHPELCLRCIDNLPHGKGEERKYV